MNIQSITELNEISNLIDIAYNANISGKIKDDTHYIEVSKIEDNTKTSYKYDFFELINAIQQKLNFISNEIQSISSKAFNGNINNSLQKQINDLGIDQAKYLPLTGGRLCGDLSIYNKDNKNTNTILSSNGYIYTNNSIDAKTGISSGSNMYCKTLFGVATSAMWC